jgi:hypothetical protein
MLLGRFAVLRGVQEIPLREFSGRACVLLVAAYTWRFAGHRREFLADLGDFEITATKTDLHRAPHRARRPFYHSRMLLR